MMIRRNRRPTAARPTAARPAVVEHVERRRLLSASLSVSQGLMVYSAVRNANSPTETLTLTNTGDATLNVGPTAFTVTGTNAGQWTLNNKTSAPATLAAGDSFGLQLTYKPTAVARQTATLTIATDDPAHPSQTVALSGIGTAGVGGTNQPSLVRILRAYNIPTIVGEGRNDSDEATGAIYPNPPDGSSEEVSLQQLVKAGTGPVSIDVLASFTATGTQPYTLGYYTPGRPQDRHELFYTPSTESQSVYVHPQGSTSFDPGGNAFGMYFVSNVQVKGRLGYSEDALNTYDTTNNRKFRFFPMRNADGTVVANTFVMTSTEWDAPIGYDFTNIVAVIRNVAAAPNAPASGTLTVTDPYALPGSSNVMFANIRFPNTTIGDTVHNTDTLTLTNTGGSAMAVTSLTLNNTNAWSITAGPTLPLVLAPGAATTVTLKYNNRSTPSSTYNQTADPNNPGGGGFERGTLTVGSTDLNTPSKVINLTGYTQYKSENQNEPSLQTIVNLLAGYGTLINGTPVTQLRQDPATTGSAPTYFGEETVSAYWTSADASRPVNVVQIAAFHTEGDADTFGYFKQGSTSVTAILDQAKLSGQSIFPTNAAGAWATGQFTTTNTFGFRLSGTAGTEWSDDTKNTYHASGGGHHMRFFPVRDAIGTLVPNTYLALMDYASVNENFDFQDNVYVVSNVRPAVGSGAAPSVPTDLAAVNATGGVALTWAPSTAGPAAGYNVYRLNGNGTFSKVNGAPVTTTSYLDATANTAATNGYRVTAVNAGAAQESVGAGGYTTLAGPPPASTRGAVTGRVWDDSNGNGLQDNGEVGLVNQLVFIDVNGTGVYASNDPVAATDKQGNWAIGGLVPGTYTVVNKAPAGFNRTLPGSSSYSVAVGANQTAARTDFGSNAPGYIVGTVFLDYNGNAALDGNEPGLGGWSVFIDNNRNGTFDAGIDTQFDTDGGGYFTTSALPVGTYVLGQMPRAGWGRSTPGLPLTVTVTERGNSRVNFGETRGSIYGTVFADADGSGGPNAGEVGIAGVRVFLDFHGTGVYQSDDLAVTTDANGNYAIVGMAPGTYTVVVTVPSGYTLTTAGSYTLTFYAGQIRTGFNFGFAGAATPAAQVASGVSGKKKPGDDGDELFA